MVPVAAMLAQYQKTTRCNTAPGFIFGTGKAADNYMPGYLADLPGEVDVTYCLSREKTVGNGEFRGRITDLLAARDENDLRLADTEFFVCGNPNMVQDVQRLLREKGAHKVFVELY